MERSEILRVAQGIRDYVHAKCCERGSGCRGMLLEEGLAGERSKYCVVCGWRKYPPTVPQGICLQVLVEQEDGSLRDPVESQEHSRYSEEEVRKVFDDIVDMKKTSREAAAEMGIDPAMLSRVFGRFGLKIRKERIRRRAAKVRSRMSCSNLRG